MTKNAVAGSIRRWALAGETTDARPSRMARRFRILTTLFFLTAGALVMFLWVRSYRRCDVEHVTLPRVPGFLVASVSGELRLEVKRTASVEDRSHSSMSGEQDPDRKIPKHWSGFRFPVPSLVPIPIVPHWFVVITAALIATVAIAGVRPRFRLRALLIATTVVSAFLAMLRCAAL